MQTVSEIGEASYNGWEFSAYAETLEFRGTPQYDSSRRTIVATMFSLTISDYIQNGDTDAQARLAIIRLTQPAAGLVYTGRGFSNVRINLGGTNDCSWGPAPRVISLTPMGGSGKTVKIVWTVEWLQPTCQDGRTSAGSIMEWCYKLSFDIDRSGYTTRRYQGHIRIAQTRPDIKIRTVQRSADEWRDQVTPAIPNKFRRVSQNWSLSEDKCKLDFTIVDEQMPPNPPPRGVVQAEANHEISCDGGKIFNWMGTISARYEIADNATVEKAVTAFFALIKDRVGSKKFEPAELKGGDGTPLTIRSAGVIIPWGFSVGEPEIYGKRSASFRFSYRVAGVDLAQILNQGGLWRATPTDRGSGLAGLANAGRDGFDLWAGSMKSAQSNRGISGLNFTANGSDFIVDLCAAVKPIPPLPTALKIAFSEAVVNLPGGPVLGANFSTALQSLLSTTFPAPPPDKSWLDYRITTITEGSSGTVESKPLPVTPIPVRPSGSTAAGWDASQTGMPTTPPAYDKPFPPLPNAGNVSVQRRTSPTLYVRLVGQALRVGYPIQIPELVSVAGATPTMVSRVDCGEGFAQSVVGNVLVPVYAASFNLRYVLNDVPQGPIGPPVNGLIGGTGPSSLL